MEELNNSSFLKQLLESDSHQSVDEGSDLADLKVLQEIPIVHEYDED